MVLGIRSGSQIKLECDSSEQLMHHLLLWAAAGFAIQHLLKQMFSAENKYQPKPYRACKFAMSLARVVVGKYQLLPAKNARVL